jgi:hypothetical protein
LVSERVITEQDGRVFVPDPGFLHHTLYAAFRFPRLNNLCAVRPVFSAGTHAEWSEEETFAAHLNVDLDDPGRLAEAMSAVWTMALQWETRAGGDTNELRRDVLIMEMVVVEACGSAIASQTRGHDVATYRTVAGEGSMALPVLGAWQSPSKELPLFGQRLQRLLGGVRRTFGPGDWQVTWVHDGDVCWLLTLLPWSDPGAHF